jgi:hypothetical protein
MVVSFGLDMASAKVYDINGGNDHKKKLQKKGIFGGILQG